MTQLFDPDVASARAAMPDARREPAIALPRTGTRAALWDVASFALVTALGIVGLFVFRHYAVSNDEPVQQHYAELIVRYYASGLSDRSVFHFDNLFLYGGLFDLLSLGLARILPFAIWDIRHLVSGAFGIAGIAAAILTARRIAGPRAGFLAGILLAGCGAWFGTMFNHTKDIPLAAAMMGATFFVIAAMRDLPRPRWRDVIGFGVCAGIALGIKVLGLLVFGYLGLAMLASAARAPAEAGRHARLRLVASMIWRYMPGFAIAYAIMALAWPYSALAPLNPVRAIFSFAEFHYHVPTILAGQVYELATVPRWYVPAYLAIKIPLPVLASATALIGVLVLSRTGKSAGQLQRPRETALVAAALIVPLTCQVVGHGPAVTGLRHFLFVLPPLAVLAALGFEHAWRRLADAPRWLAIGLAGMFGLWLAWNAVTLIRLHPFQYVYYNELVGGTAGAARRYVGDYWVMTMRPAVHALGEYVAHENARTGERRDYTVAVCGDRQAFEAEPHAGLMWTSDWGHADFFIAPTHMSCDRVLDGDTIATIARLGAPIGMVKDLRRHQGQKIK